MDIQEYSIIDNDDNPNGENTTFEKMDQILLLLVFGGIGICLVILPITVRYKKKLNDQKNILKELKFDLFYKEKKFEDNTAEKEELKTQNGKKIDILERIDNLDSEIDNLEKELKKLEENRKKYRKYKRYDINDRKRIF